MASKTKDKKLKGQIVFDDGRLYVIDDGTVPGTGRKAQLRARTKHGDYSVVFGPLAPVMTLAEGLSELHKKWGEA